MNCLKTCCFTGHRPHRLPWGEDEGAHQCICCKAALAIEVERAWQEGYRRFLTGMAMGGDLIWAEAVLACQTVHPDVVLEAVIPCAKQTQKWPLKEVQRYQSILEAIGPERQTVLQRRYTKDCMLQRDRYMVDQSQRVIALYDGKDGGGTRYTLEYAMSRRRETVIIDPCTLKVVR